MHKIKFTKVKNDHNRLRDNIIEGQCNNLPELDKPFIFTGPGKEFGTRLVQTSPVKTIEIIDNLYRVTTESKSVYKIEVL
jgi:hypothetical protein